MYQLGAAPEAPLLARRKGSSGVMGRRRVMGWVAREAERERAFQRLCSTVSRSKLALMRKLAGRSAVMRLRNASFSRRHCSNPFTGPRPSDSASVFFPSGRAQDTMSSPVPRTELIHPENTLL